MKMQQPSYTEMACTFRKKIMTLNLDGDLQCCSKIHYKPYS